MFDFFFSFTLFETAKVIKAALEILPPKRIYFTLCGLVNVQSAMGIYTEFTVTNNFIYILKILVIRELHRNLIRWLMQILWIKFLIISSLLC